VPNCSRTKQQVNDFFPNDPLPPRGEAEPACDRREPACEAKAEPSQSASQCPHTNPSSGLSPKYSMMKRVRHWAVRQ
jgi:hypothetical protein